MPWAHACNTCPADAKGKHAAYVDHLLTPRKQDKEVEVGVVGVASQAIATALIDCCPVVGGCCIVRTGRYTGCHTAEPGCCMVGTGCCTAGFGCCMVGTGCCIVGTGWHSMNPSKPGHQSYWLHPAVAAAAVCFALWFARVGVLCLIAVYVWPLWVYELQHAPAPQVVLQQI